MKKILNVTLAVCACIGITLSAQAKSENFLSCGLKTDNFSMLIDASGSMMDTLEHAKEKADAKVLDEDLASQTVAQLAKDLTIKIGQSLGDEKLSLALLSIAPYAELSPFKEVSGKEFSEITSEKFNVAMEIFRRPSVVGERAHNFFNLEDSGKQVAILVTDGQMRDDIYKVVEDINNFTKVNPKAKLYIISAAYAKEGQDFINSLEGVSKVYDLETLLIDEKAYEAFLSETLYADCTKVGSIEIQGINFAFDKDNIDAKSAAILDRVIEVLNSRPADEKFRIEAWTDYMGSDAYNADLSQRRARSVRTYLIEKGGIDPNRISSYKGRGKSFKYDNSTSYGRYQNRHAEVIFE